MTRFQRIALISAFSLLAVIAALGWARHSPVNASASPANAFNSQAYADPALAPTNTNQAYVTAPAASYADRHPVSRIERRAAEDRVASTTNSQRYATDNGPRYYSGPRSYVKERPFSHSAAIVGGSAAGGAAVGALAGGGKGAAIGALAGGVGGLIFDRKTHKKTVTQY